MGANPFIELVERRGEQQDIHVLFVGSALEGAKKVFKRDDEPVKCSHAGSPSDAIEVIVERSKSVPFDCVMVDMRSEADGSALNVVAIAALNAASRIVVLANPEDVDTFEQIVGVDTVLPAPIDPKAIILTIMRSAPKSPEFTGEEVNDEQAELTPVEPQPVVAVAEPVHEAKIVSPAEAPVEPETAATDEAEKKSPVTKGFESSLSLAAEADQQVWQRFVPLANFVYKKLAIIVLSALFVAFLTYGAMIVFFMTSSSWSLPMELSRGHALVEKVERDLSSMRLRRNEIKQSLAVASLDLANAQRELRDGKLNLALTERTLAEEMHIQKAQKLEIAKQIGRLKQVIADFNKLNRKGGLGKSLENAFARRLITQKAMNGGTLAVLETMHRIATVENEVSVKQLEADRVDRRLEYLAALRAELKQPEVRVVVSAGADMSHLAREVIETKNRIAGAEKVVAASKKRTDTLDNSLQVISANITNIEATPVARALDGPVAVMFVPYQNADQWQEGETLSGCALSILWCSEIGVVGARVEGETLSVHPLFGKPLRGFFVEAKFTKSSHVTKELVHVGGSPFLF